MPSFFYRSSCLRPFTLRYFAFAFFILVLSVSQANATEEPAHTVLLEDGDIQVRQYEPMIVAEVTVSGDMGEASNAGFRPLADFIFGNNVASEEIKMTAPVTRSSSTEIEMTAPVTRQTTGDDQWVVAFVMPSKWTMDTLPKPNNNDIRIRAVEAQTMATIEFSGRADQEDFDEQWQELKEWLETNDYSILGEPKYAGYNAPIVPGLFRRNEVMVHVAERESNEQAARVKQAR